MDYRKEFEESLKAYKEQEIINVMNKIELTKMKAKKEIEEYERQIEVFKELTCIQEGKKITISSNEGTNTYFIGY